MTTPSLRVYPLLYLTHLCHIKTIYGPYMGHPSSPTWTLDFEPAFSPRFSFPLSPRSFFHTRQRFPISNHVTSGCMSPRSTFDQWSAVSHTGNDMTSSSDHVIALDQSGASICPKRAHCTTSRHNQYWGPERGRLNKKQEGNTIFPDFTKKVGQPKTNTEPLLDDLLCR